MIFQATWKLILSGKKTQTRRIREKGDVFSDSFTKVGRGNHPRQIPAAIFRNNRQKWQVGKTYSVEVGRGSWSVGRIKVTGLRLEQLQAISEADAIKEGFASIDEFKRTWQMLHIRKPERWRDNPKVWVIEFELVEATNDYE